MLSDEEELEKIKKLERACPNGGLLLNHGILEWDDSEKVKFHKYVKGVAQKLLGDLADLDDEDLVFLLSKGRQANAASVTLKNGERFIYFDKGLLDMCENEDQFAFILAHELQHWLERKDLPADIKGATKAEETKCDILAVEKMRTAGYELEEGYKIAAKLFEGGSAGIFQVLDEHPLSEHRVKYIGVKVLEVRESMIKSGKYQKKTPVTLYNPDISLWEYDALEKFFKQDKYAQADAKQKMELWFEQFDRLSNGENGLQKISAKDLQTLQYEYYHWANEIEGNKELTRVYEEMYCERVLKLQTLSEFNIVKHNFWYLVRPHFWNESAKQKKLLADYFKPFRESVGEKTKLYCAKLTLLRAGFSHDCSSLLDLSDKPLHNIGVRFSQDVIDAIIDKQLDAVHASIVQGENGGMMLFVDEHVYQLDKNNTIQKYLGTRNELKQINDAQKYNEYFELYNKLQANEASLCEANVKKILEMRSLINKMEKEKFRSLEKYLSPEALGYLTAHFKKKPVWDEKVCDILCQYMKKEDKTPEDAAGYEKFMKNSVFGYFVDDWQFVEQKKLVDTYFLAGGTRFPDFACQVTAEMLARHLKAGKDLDDFQFPYDKQFYAYNEKFLADLAAKEKSNPYAINDPFLVEHISSYACFELLKKNPKIDLSQVYDMEHSERSCDSYLASYFPFELTEKDVIADEWFTNNAVYNRLYDNITNLDNWGDGRSAISDLPYYKRVCAALSEAKLLQDDRSNQIKIDTLRNFYKRASIEDKIEYVVEALETHTVKSMYKNMFNDDNWALYQEDLLNKNIPLEKKLQFAGKIRTTPENTRITLIKDVIWRELQEKIASPELSITQKIELFNEIAKIEVLDSDKSKYFETLLGKDGKGGLLDEISKSSEKSFEIYKKLLLKDNRIPDPKVRSRVIKLAVQQFIRENGHYNDIKAGEQERDDFVLQVRELKKQLKSEFSVVDEHEFLRCLADQSFSQQRLSDVIKPDPAKIDIKNQNIINAAYGLDGLTYLFKEGILDRNAVIEYMLSEGKEEDTKKIMEIVTKCKESQEYSDVDWKGYDQINESLFINAKKEFDQAPLPVQACIMTYLAQGCDWNNQFEVVADKLFYQTGELGETSRKFLKSYISSRPESERYFYLSAMYSASQNKSNFTDNINDSKYTKEERSVAEGLRLFLENSGPAGVKLAQAMSSYNGVPNFIKDEMQKAKNNANPPARWEVFDWLEQTQQTEALGNGKIGKLLGSASFFVTYDMIDGNGEDRVIKINRLGSANKAEIEFEIYKDTLAKLKEEFPQISAFRRLIDNASDMVNVETDLGIGEEQLRYAQRLYPEKINAGGQEFNVSVMDWVARGQTWAVMEKAFGEDFGNLAPDYKKKAAQAVFTMELTNILSGQRFDSDRHAGQYKFDVETNTIGIFDTGSMSVIEPGEKEKRVLGLVLAETVKSLANNNDTAVGAVLCREIDKGIEKYYKEEIAAGTPIPPYLSEFQRGLLALTDFHKELSAGELSICLMQALNNGKQKLDPLMYQGFIEGMSGGGEAKLSSTTKEFIKELVVDTILSPYQEGGQNKTAQSGQHYGQLLFDKILESGESYDILTHLPPELKSQDFAEVLDSSVGRIHFAKGVMKSCFSHIDPRLYTSEDKQQVGAILYQVIEKGMKMTKLKEPVVLSQLFTDTAKQFEPLGEYAKNISSVLKVAGQSMDVDSFSKAVIFGRFIDENVQNGYVRALRESSNASLIKKTLSHISVKTLIPQKSARKIAKFMIKKVGPACMDILIKTAVKGREQLKQKDLAR